MTTAKADIAPLDGAWTSALAAELASIPRRVRSTVGLPDAAIQFLEVFMRMLRVLLNDDDPRELADRATDLAPMLETLVGDGPDAAALERFLQPGSFIADPPSASTINRG